MTDHIMTLIDELRKAGLHEDLEIYKKGTEYLDQKTIELEAQNAIYSTRQDTNQHYAVIMLKPWIHTAGIW